MKRLLILFALLICCSSIHAQVNSQRVVFTGSATPTACISGKVYTTTGLSPAKAWVGTSAGTCTPIDPASAGAVIGPTSAVDNHLAVFNGTTGKLIKDGGAIPSATPAGSTTQVQFNNAGAFGGITNVTTNGTNFTALGTLPAFTLGGTVSGGGQQLNNIIIGTATPLAGSFTGVIATSVNISGTALPSFDATDSVLSVGANSSVAGTTGPSATGHQIIAQNLRYDGTNYKYISTAAGSAIVQTAGGFSVGTALSGTAGNTASVTTQFQVGNTGILTAATLAGTGSRPVFADASGNLSAPSSATFTGDVTVSSGSFGLSGAISASAWTTSGIRYKNVASTLTDTTSSGTVAAAYTNVFGANTIAASSATTFTNYFNTYFNDPVAGSNVTLTNKWALGADSLAVAGKITQTSASATAFESGPNGGTNPVLRLVNSTASQADGISITGAAAGSGTTIAALSSGSNSSIIFTPKGTGSIVVPDGLVSTPSIAFNSDTTTGIYRGTSQVKFAIGGVLRAFVGQGGVVTDSLFLDSANADVVLSRAGAATIQHGAATGSGAPVNQAVTTQGRTGSDVSGGNLRISSGLGTGIGTVSTLSLQSPLLGVTGSTAQVATTGLTIRNGTAVLTSYTVATLPAAATAGAGAMAFITDSTTTAITGLGLAPVGSGANKVIVYSDGSGWLIL